MRLIKGCFIFIGVITVLLFLLAGFGYCLLSLSPPLRAQMIPVALTPAAVQSLDHKLEVFTTEIKKAVAAGLEREISLVITEEEANSKLVLAIGEGKLPLREVLVNFRKDVFLAYGALKTPGLSVKVGIKAYLELTGGKPKFIIEELQCGRLPLPKEIRKNVGDLLVVLFKVPMANLSGIFGELPWQATGIYLTDGQMIIKGVTKKGW